MATIGPFTIADTASTFAGDWYPNSTSAAPAYWAPCGHSHVWGIACSVASVNPNHKPWERTFGPCPKCDSTDLLVAFHDGKSHCADCRKEGVALPMCKNSDECGERGIRRQHLRVHCRRCQFGWRETPGMFKEEPPR